MFKLSIFIGFLIKLSIAEKNSPLGHIGLSFQRGCLQISREYYPGPGKRIEEWDGELESGQWLVLDDAQRASLRHLDHAHNRDLDMKLIGWIDRSPCRDAGKLISYAICHEGSCPK